MKAFRRFTVRVQLPSQLQPLTELAANLRWSWHRPTQEVFADIDPDVWTETADPLRVLEQATTERLTELAADTEFVARVSALAADLAEYRNSAAWFGALAQQRPVPASIAYFSMEFGITEVLPIYSGGLGILAGDHLKAASDLGLPLVGVGLFYRSGYFRQSLTADGWQIENYPVNDARTLPLRQLTDGDVPVEISVSMPGGRTLTARVWVATVGRISLLLLDADVPVNDDELRGVTDRLYGGDQDHRIKQEILLGVGGVRAVREYVRLSGTPAPEVFHMNEGHGGFLGLERIRELVTADELTFEQAEAVVRASLVFTTHTPVPAGIDRFPMGLVRHYLDADDSGASRLLPGLPVDVLCQLGDEAAPDVFNMAHLGLRLGQRSNGVSKLHGAVSRKMFGDLWPGFDTAEVPIGSVTNGVHGDTWRSGRWPADAEQSDAEIWAVRNELRGNLVDEVRRRVYRSGRARGHSEAELSWTRDVFDPRILTIGFARRAATYKRLTLMLRDPDRLRRLLLDPQRPIQLVVAGKAHPADDGGKSLIQQIVRFTDDPALRGRIVFLPDYDIGMARHIYAGCDVWLNNPVRPMEACGTSGMKSALNGGLNLSILDGWWDEMADGHNGWAIPSADEIGDEHRRDDIEANALYELLEQTVVPLFYSSGTEDTRTLADDGVPTRWVDMVRHTIDDLGPQVLAERMVRDYTTELYSPAAQSFRDAVADDYALARDLAAYRDKVTAAWPSVSVAGVDEELPPHAEGVVAPGSSVALTAHVSLGGLSPAEVTVEAVGGTVDADGEILDPVTTTLTAAEGRDESGRALFVGGFDVDRSGRLGYTVRVLPRHRGLAVASEVGLVRYP
ncbi:glycosyltransferase family 1 protein [Gordonia sp. TBRC 11910]|uniref:glycogen phosphorylase n=1 Tax=Gordonia asplenii TaxID=2725283 RepID=A0A848L9M7_9ACTN|nr:alpha-glucan family phosphorylase [Gordonia asplenii]NMO05161.1 glycosyltransferase family 1 protein [Gordonia asplenii]